jgi:cytochrome c oxidase subunit 1
MAYADDAAHHGPQSFWTRYIWSQDHKVIAVQYTLVAIVVGLIGVTLSNLMRMQLGFPGFDFIDANRYYQFVTMHGMIMVIYLLTALFLGGFGNYLIPLMVGARDMVFPFLNMLSFWVYFLSVLVLLASFFVPGGPTGAGWTLYPPQAILPGTPGHDWGIILMLVSLLIFIVAATMGGLNYVTTVLQARTEGMTMLRMPLAVWGIFMATILALLAFPALFVSGVMMLLDKTLGTSFFMPAMVSMGQQLNYKGGSPLLFQHLFWFFGHPEVYIVALPAFGIVSDLISVHSRKSIFGYRTMVWAILAIGVLSVVVWAHHMFVSGMNPYFGFFFATTTLIIAVPTAIKVYNWVITLWRGDIHFSVPMLFAIAFISTFVIGGLTGLFLGNVSVDIPLSNTYFVVAHFHMVMGVSPILVVFGGSTTGIRKSRTPAQRHARPHSFLDHVRRHLRHLLSDALPRHSGHAAALLRVGQLQLHSRVRAHDEHVYLDRSVHRRGGAVAVRLQPVLERAAWQPPAPTRGVPPRWNGRRRRRRPRTATGGASARGLSLGLRVQRAGREGGLHRAERAARAGGANPNRTREGGRGMKAESFAVDTGGGVFRARVKPRRRPRRWRRLAWTWGPHPGSLGLWVFMGVVTALFTLFLAAYVMRMDSPDWQRIALPWQVWLSTAVLAAACVAMEIARRAAHSGRMVRARHAFRLGDGRRGVRWRAVVGVAGAVRGSRRAGEQSGGQLLLPAHGHARSAHAWRAGGLRVCGGGSRQWHAHGDAHRAVRALLALPAGGMGRVARRAGLADAGLVAYICGRS